MTERESVLDLSLLSMINPLLRHRRLLGIIIAAVTVATVTFGLIFRRYNAEVRFYPATEDQTGGVAALAAQFGFSISGTDLTDSPDFYLELLQSRELLTAVATTQYRFPASDGSVDTLHGTFIDLYGVSEDTPQLTVLKAIDKLSGKISASKDVASGVLTIDVTTKWQGLSEQIGRRLLDILNQFNLERRQQQATAERQFIESRVAQAADSLHRAEDTMAVFLAANRSYANSPWLTFQEDRLQRRVTLAQTVYTTLVQAYEQARIEEVRNTPVITVVDNPEGSGQPSMTVLVLIALGGFVGVVLAIGIVLVREYFGRDREKNPLEYDQFESLRQAATSDLRRVTRWPWRKKRPAESRANGGGDA